MAEEEPESSWRRQTRTLGLTALRSAAPFITGSWLERLVRPTCPPPLNPARRVGLMRPHGSSLIGGSGSPFSFPSAGEASGNGGGVASGSGGGHASGNGGGLPTGSGGGHASGSGGGQGTGGPCRRRRQQRRANPIVPVAVDPPLSFGGGFSVDMHSSFFNTTDLRTSPQAENIEAYSGQDTGINLNEPASDSALPQGYRGVGYNPNFENADEYPPSQTSVQANPRKIIDLNDLANKRTRKFYSTEEKRQIYQWIQQLNGTSSKMKRGVTAEVAILAKCPPRVVTRIWRQGINGGGINSVKCGKIGKVGRKKNILDIEVMEAIPTTERTTIRQLAEAMNMPKSTVFQRLKEKEIRRVTNDVKPMLGEENKKQHLLYALHQVEPCTLFDDEPTMKGGFNVAHYDEKWFYRIRRKENIGVWAYVEWVQAQKRSANRKRGDWELKPCTEVDKAKTREYLVKFILPAIKAKWPASDRHKPIYIQQDNARTHIQPDDPIFVSEAARGDC
ncbi:hypothetical protein QYE76_031867 [Lolium multiflorum]|uniref:Transposase n=1 Tax=Lolium multiflorum TaxID=4521 RepID=A0AAD8VIU6_LOLMU|nr:hypothetical protein QYE76_031867 [Lolium multiflorum]